MKIKQYDRQEESKNQLVDRYQRRINYVRFSVTDRCDFRCTYCMSEKMTFLPRQKILTLEELHFLGTAFVELGVNKIRITGGEPMVRSNVMSLFDNLGEIKGLDQLVMTTNGSQLEKFAQPLKDAGVKRINISLDTLQKDRFKAITRTGELACVLKGIKKAREVGFEKLKINSVIMRGENDDEIFDLIRYARDNELDITFIEEMPLGDISDHQRKNTYVSSDWLREKITEVYPLQAPTAESDSAGKVSGGPSKYFTMADSNSRVGFISPHSHNFCDTCNRVRVTAEGRLLLCLGNEHSVDLRAVLRQHPGDMEILKSTIISAMEIKPKSHEFDLDGEPGIVRFMNQTGG